MIRRLTFAVLLSALGFAAGCRASAPRVLLGPLPAGPSPSEAAELAEQIRDPAHAAEVLWLFANDRPAARARLDAGLRKAPGAPGLLLRRALVSLQSLDARAVTDDLVSIIERHPTSPEAEFALVMLHEYLDALWSERAIIERAILASGLLEHPKPGSGRITLATALLAAIAHRDADDVRAEGYLRRGGYFGQLRRLGPLGPADPGALPLAAPFEASPDWAPPKRPGDVRVTRAGPEPGFSGGARPGVYVFDGFFEVSARRTPAPLVLETALPANARVRVDETLVLEKDATRRLSPGRSQVELQLAPGWHRLVISAVLRPSDRISVALTTQDGRPVVAASRSGVVARTERAPSSTTTDALEGPPPATAWALVHELLADPARAAFGRLLGARLAQSHWYDAKDRAGRLLRGTRGALPESAAFAFAAARLAARRGLRSESRAMLQEGLHSDPTHPGALTGLARALRDERPERAYEIAKRASKLAPTAWGPRGAMFTAASALGWTAEAISAIDATLACAPPDAVFVRAAQFFRGLELHARADAVEAALDRVDPHGAPARAAERLIRSGDIDGAIAALSRAAKRSTPEVHLARIAELQLARHRPAEARAAAEAASTFAPDHAPAMQARLRAALLEGDLPGAEASLESLRCRGESTLELEALLGTLEPHPALAAFLEHDRWQGVLPATPGALPPGRDPADRWAAFDEVVLLDRVVDQLLPDGRVLTWHHDITRLQTKEATDRAGETNVPPDALLLTMRTLKQDGREVEVDRHAGKDDLSFSALAPGDAIERRWVRIEGHPSAYGGYLRRFYFRAAAPLVRSELAVVVPAGLDIQFVAQRGAPAPVVTSTQGVTLYTWRADDVPAVTPEPLGVGADELLPKVEVWANLDPARARLAQLAATRLAVRGSATVDHVARTLTATIAAPEAKLERLFLWAKDNLDAGPIRPPEEVITRERGDRAGTLVALARAAGIPAELVLAQDGLHSSPTPGVPDPEPFGEHLVRAEPRPGAVLWAKLDDGRSWLGPLPPRFRGGRILRDAAPPRTERITDDQLGRRIARSRVALEIDAAGTASGTVTLVVPAALAEGMRRFLDSARAQVVAQQLQALAAGLVRGARLVEHRWSGGPLEDLSLTLTVEAPGFMRRDGDHLVVEELFERPLVLQLTRQPLLDAYLAVPHRETPLLVRPAEERLEVSLRLPREARAPTVAPRGFEAKWEEGEVEQRFHFDAASRTAHLTLHYRTNLARVPPERFDAFARQAQASLQALRNRLVVEVVPRSARR